MLDFQGETLDYDLPVSLPKADMQSKEAIDIYQLIIHAFTEAGYEYEYNEEEEKCFVFTREDDELTYTISVDIGLVSRDGNIVNQIEVWAAIEDEDFETENQLFIHTTTDDGKLLTYEEIFSNAGSIIQIVENDITEEFYDKKRENL